MDAKTMLINREELIQNYRDAQDELYLLMESGQDTSDIEQTLVELEWVMNSAEVLHV